MSAIVPVELPVDTKTAEQLARGEKTTSGKVKKNLTSRWATVAAIAIAVVWTIPTFGLFVSSFRPKAEVVSTGWWTIFENWGFTFDNYVEVLASGNTQLTMAQAFLNSIVIALPATVIPLAIALLAAYGFAWMDFKERTGCSSWSSHCRSCRSRWRSFRCFSFSLAARSSVSR